MNKSPVSQLTLAAALVLVAVIGGEVTLIVTDHGDAVASLAPVLVAVAPLIGLQIKTQSALAETKEQMGYVLNGGMTDRMKQVATATITRMAAADETHGTSVVADAAATVAPQEPPVPPSVAKAVAAQAPSVPPDTP